MDCNLNVYCSASRGEFIGGGVLRRNNTSFPVQLTARLRTLHSEYVRLRADPKASERALWASILKYYQFMCREYMCNPEFGVGTRGNGRGLLVNHSMGMGKTRLGVAVAMALWDTRTPVILLPRSLQRNFMNEVRAAVASLHPEAEGDALARLQDEAVAAFKFVSLDAFNMADQMMRIGQPKVRGVKSDFNDPGALDGKLLIVDEAHNFMRAIINSGSENTNARRLYDTIMEAKDLRLLFLTGTIPTKSFFELPPCFNMLSGEELLPPLYDTFERLYVDQANGAIKNAGYLANRLFGLISHISPMLPTSPGDETVSESAAKSQIRADGGFPEQFPRIIERIQMAPAQYRRYLAVCEKEDAEGKNADGRGFKGEQITKSRPLSLPGSERKSARTYFVRSRTLSSFSPAREFIGKTVASMPDEAFNAQSSPKYTKLVANIEKSPGKALVYSQFVEMGLAAVARFLQNAGYERFVPPSRTRRVEPAEEITGGAGPKRFAIISGEVSSDERDAIVRAFNARDNTRGESLRVLLVSKTGAEGLDLKCIRQVHIVEPAWGSSTLAQVDARAVRLGSHDDLPADERDVQRFLYVAVANEEVRAGIPVRDREPQTRDETFLERAENKFKLLVKFRELTRSVSIECSLFQFPGCRTCIPTGSRLYSADYEQDTRLPDPCETTVAKEVEAKEITVDGVVYYYAEDAGEASGYRVYEFREDLGGNVAVDLASPVYLDIVEAIKKVARI
ncbi:MAG: DEAD/DEAH box helicase [Patescibacteria group bacterium]|nr:DEAD/DEAH box helicase [Patescibacteria group bacterium]